jgi:Tetracyclin repressor-like, C-terminal domain
VPTGLTRGGVTEATPGEDLIERDHQRDSQGGGVLVQHVGDQGVHADPGPDGDKHGDDWHLVLIPGGLREVPLQQRLRLLGAVPRGQRDASLRANMFTGRNRLMREILDRAAARGDIAPAAVTPQFIELAPALVDHHFLMHGAPIPDEVLTGIVDNVLLPLLTAPAT